MVAESDVGEPLGVCRLCGTKSKTISNVVGVCARCLRTYGREALKISSEVHHRYRHSLGLPPQPPRAEKGARCGLCVNECSIPPGGLGFCGLWTNEEGALCPLVGYRRGVLYAYLDPLPTNCVATPVCPAGTGAGYPKFCMREGPEYGYYNLAVFFAACNLNCLFCQNKEHKDIAVSSKLRTRYLMSVEELARRALEDARVTCVCYFGGDPGPQAPYALEASRLMVERAEEKGLVKRVCWETNGLESPAVMHEMAELSLRSGGVVKIDWKAFSPEVYEALCGIDGVRAVERVKENIKLVAELANQRPEVALLVVSILLVPGYVDDYELEGMADYIASVDKGIPVVLLAFHADHLLRDLPPTSTSHAKRALEIFRARGIEKVFVGNAWLLGPYY